MSALSLRPSNLDLTEAADHLIRTDFRHFVTAVFHELNPGEKLQWNWHLDLICYMLCRTLPETSPFNPTPSARVRKLIVNVPPRSLKSIIISVAYRAFILGHYPHERIVGASYSGKLSYKLNSDCMKIMRAPWYARIFPQTVLDKETEAKFTTSRGGHSIGTSVGGTVTGEGGNYLLADDIVNPQQAASDLERAAANNWFSQSYYPSRLDNKKTGVCVIVMQRLHEEDLTGFCMAKNDELPPPDRWALLELSAEALETKAYDFYNDFRVFEQGDVLHPERDSREMLAAIRKEIGSYAYASQYLQRPAPAGGGMLPIANFARYSSLPAPPSAAAPDADAPPPAPGDERLRVVQSWDTAIKASASADYTVCTTWLETRSRHYLLDLFIAKLEYPDLKRAVQSLSDRFHPSHILIEDRASGQQLLQDLRRETALPVIPFQPGTQKDAKIVRAASASAVLEAGAVAIPADAEQYPWWDEFERQVMFFPNARNDDIVDSMTQYLDWVRKTPVFGYRIRSV